MRAKRTLCSLALWIVLAIRPAVSQAQTKIDVKPNAEIGAKPGQQPPDFTLKTVAGTTVTLSELRGRPVVINFWASWCPPCRTEMPLLVAAYQAHRDVGLEVLAVNMTDQDSKKDMRKFVAEFAMPFSVPLDEKGMVRKLYGLIAYPTSVFVGSDGIVRVAHSGPIDGRTLDRNLAAVLAAQ